MAIKIFIAFNETFNHDKCLDNDVKLRLTDEKAREEIKKKICGVGIAEIKSLSRVQRDEIIMGLKEIEGISQRQMARILGISPNLVFKV